MQPQVFLKNKFAVGQLYRWTLDSADRVQHGQLVLPVQCVVHAAGPLFEVIYHQQYSFSWNNSVLLGTPTEFPPSPGRLDPKALFIRV